MRRDDESFALPLGFKISGEQKHYSNCLPDIFFDRFS
jgi:hypothetical protein